MCGRTRVSLAPEQVLRAAGTARWVNREAYQPSYNVSPGSPTPVVVAGADGLQVQTMRWGLVPSFTKKDDRPDFWRMFNARSESVAEKPAFRRLVPSRRCLVLVDAFYEWQKQKDGTKQPYHIYLAPPKSETAGSSGATSQGQEQQQEQQQHREQAAEEPMVFAGLWDVWDGPEGPMHTYTILTTDSSKRLEWLHDPCPSSCAPRRRSRRG
jgi:putative SOS response-associated peptidase YedK